ncbi:hypothetical protein GXM_09170 [Nostoc sphaeroides CCNUC1]|uniref:Uncharacterized protein n=1 Tax=Nostoc sphaeroides CCNUC1 TaxID=2653204 RepID=A0A5P8WHN6_9NOSO|nr:hypothetical protein GXM_09170 [Nostoc sphaeroides CCNUC1]
MLYLFTGQFILMKYLKKITSKLFNDFLKRSKVTILNYLVLSIAFN